MSRELSALVVDASVAVKLFLPEPLSENAARLFEGLGLEVPLRIFVPDLFYTECANVLWKSARRLGMSDASVIANLEELLTLGLERISAPVLAVEALRNALDNNISVYDAMYVTAADRLRLPLVTADKKLVERLNKRRHDVRWLGDV